MRWLVVSLLFAVATAVTFECHPLDALIEVGCSSCCYIDHDGFPAIGYGFSLERYSEWEHYASKFGFAEPMAVLHKCAQERVPCGPKKVRDNCITEEMALELAEAHIHEVEQCVEEFAPAAANHPDNVINALKEIALLEGCSSLKINQALRVALAFKRYSVTPVTLKNERWCKRYPHVCERIIGCISQQAEPHTLLKEKEATPCDGHSCGEVCCPSGAVCCSKRNCCTVGMCARGGGCCPNAHPFQCGERCCARKDGDPAEGVDRIPSAHISKRPYSHDEL